MRNIAGIIAVLLCIGIISGHRDAWGDRLDAPQRFENIWHGIANWNGAYNRTETVEMTITITTTDDGQDISWKINGRTLDHVYYEYPTSKLQDRIPLLCVYAREGENEHIFCGILYDEISWDDRIRGVYEVVSSCQISGKSKRCGEVLAIELQAEIDKYDGHK